MQIEMKRKMPTTETGITRTQEKRPTSIQETGVIR
jgi:hypothetical protein